jgi:hypothetical protein
MLINGTFCFHELTYAAWIPKGTEVVLSANVTFSTLVEFHKHSISYTQ